MSFQVQCGTFYPIMVSITMLKTFQIYFQHGKDVKLKLITSAALAFRCITVLPRTLSRSVITKSYC